MEITVSIPKPEGIIKRVSHIVKGISDKKKEDERREKRNGENYKNLIKEYSLLRKADKLSFYLITFGFIFFFLGSLVSYFSPEKIKEFIEPIANNIFYIGVYSLVLGIIIMFLLNVLAIKLDGRKLFKPKKIK